MLNYRENHKSKQLCDEIKQNKWKPKNPKMCAMYVKRKTKNQNENENEIKNKKKNNQQKRQIKTIWQS